MFVENKPGASSNIAMQECAATADGHTLICECLGKIADAWAKAMKNPQTTERLRGDTALPFWCYGRT